MPIQSKQVIENKPLAHQHAIKLKYTFDDGHVSHISCRGRNANSADEILLSKEQQVIDSKALCDLQKSLENGSDEPTQDTTQVQMYKTWMIKGYRSDEPAEAYYYLSKVAVKVIELGLTVQQLANIFNEPVETVQLVFAKWQYLDANKDTINNYVIVKDGM